jgi:hypothetical protein
MRSNGRGPLGGWCQEGQKRDPGGASMGILRCEDSAQNDLVCDHWIREARRDSGRHGAGVLEREAQDGSVGIERSRRASKGSASEGYRGRIRRRERSTAGGTRKDEVRDPSERPWGFFAAKTPLRMTWYAIIGSKRLGVTWGDLVWGRWSGRLEKTWGGIIGSGRARVESSERGASEADSASEGYAGIRRGERSFLEGIAIRG